MTSGDARVIATEGHTVLSPAVVAASVAAMCDVGEVISCRLHRAYVNDVYRLDTTAGSWCVKVYRRGWRGSAAVRREADIMRQFHRAGIPVPIPLATRAGSDVLVLPAPEGERVTLVLAWIPGEKPRPPFEPALYRRVGEAVARLHEAMAVVTPVPGDRQWDVRSLLLDPLDVIQATQDEAVSALAVRAVQRVLRVMEQWSLAAASGYCHGDATLDNLLLHGDEIAFFDFDLGGWSWRGLDMVGIAGWALDEPDVAGTLWRAYREGYEAVAPLSAADDVMLRALVIAHAVWEIGHDIRWTATWFGDSRMPDRERFLRLDRLCDAVFGCS